MSYLDPKVLDERGRCCGRKPLFYKTKSGLRSQHDPHHFCCRCCAEFGLDGKQRANWGYAVAGDGFTPTYPEQEYWRTEVPV